MHNPIIAPAKLALLDKTDTADMGLMCHCGDTLTPNGRCLNVGACFTADTAASRTAPGETLKARMAPAAWTISGNID